MNHGDAKLGVAWEEPVKDSPDRKRLSLALSLGAVGQAPCRIVENTKRENPQAPSHLVFHTPIEGQDLRVGALWPGKSRTGAEYLTGNIDLHAFGLLELRGGVKVDFRRVGDRLPVRLSKNEDRKSERSPSHVLWRMTPIPKEKRAAGGPASVVASIAETDLEFPDESEEFEEEEIDTLS